MPRLALVLALLTLSLVRAFAIELKNATVRFASAAEGREILERKDDFIERLSPFDRAGRMKVDRPVSPEEFLHFVGQSVLEWTVQERKRLATILTVINARLRDVPLSLPARVVLIKTNGSEEWNAAYSRGTAIVLSQHAFAQTADLERLICHELFHILSRHNPELRERLYTAIGFAKFDEVVLPSEIEVRRITDPDAPHNDHFIKVEVEGEECVGVPILYSKSATYDARGGGGVRQNVQFQFLVAKNAEDLARAEIAGSGPEICRPRASLWIIRTSGTQHRPT